MYLVQILLPLRDRAQKPFQLEKFEQVASELLERFGGMTAYVRSPASGLWQEPGGRMEPDDITVHEVMTASLDEQWWAEYRLDLEARFAQDDVVIRAIPMQRL